MCAWKRLEVIGVDAVASTEKRERDRVNVGASGVEGGRYGPGAATAASEASPFFLQAFLPPPRFTPASFFPSRHLLLPLDSLLLCLRLPFCLNFSFLLLLFISRFPFSLFLSLSLDLPHAPSLFLPSRLYPSISLSLLLSLCHPLCISRALFIPFLVTLSQSIQSYPPPLPRSLQPRNAFQPPPTPPRCNLPLSSGPLPPSILPRSSPSPLCHPLVLSHRRQPRRPRL